MTIPRAAPSRNLPLLCPVLLWMVAACSGYAVAAESEAMVVLISANTEWKAVLAQWPQAAPSSTPLGEWFAKEIRAGSRDLPVVFFHGGWGKIAAAASTQLAIDRWKPRLLINLGTCGGFRGSIERGEVILVEKTIVYDIVEQMGDGAEAIAHYTTPLDLAWVGRDLPRRVRRGLLLSADRDIIASEIPKLKKTYQGVAADWESGAIAYVARANHTPLLILRGVSDLVDEKGGDAYGNLPAFESGTAEVMKELTGQLSFWLSRWNESHQRRE